MKAVLIPVLGAALIGGAMAGVGLTALAKSGSTGSPQATIAKGAMHENFGGVSGTVTATSGSTITVTGKDGGIYTINASGATVEKYVNGASATVAVANISVGDTVTVNGSVVTATIAAKDIRDGTFPTPVMPVAVGKVTAISGSTITISGMSKPVAVGTKPVATTYTVDASNAVITKMTASTSKGTKPTTTTITVSGVSVGDSLSVQGTANGSAITATTITDSTGLGMRGGFGGMKKGS